MKSTWKRTGGAGLALLGAAVLLWTAVDYGKQGVDGGFEYRAGLVSAELTGVVAEPGAASGDMGESPAGGRLEVPKWLGGKRVARVGPRAFCPCTNTISVKIPRRVTRIGEEAFAGCKNLVWVELPAGLERVEDGLFRNCRSMAESVLPPRVAEIGAHAYSGCAQLSRLTLPGNLRFLGPHAFSGCHSLERLELPQGIDNIPEGAFEGCVGLQSIRLPAGVTNIGARAFAGCVSLAEIELPASLRSIGDEAFAGCEGLLGMELPSGLEAMEGGVFAGCSRLEDLSVREGNVRYKTEEGALLTADGRVLLASSARPGGTPSIPDGVLEIADGAFADCEWLESVSLPASVERLGARAFAGCRHLKTVELPSGLSAMGLECFRRTGLERVALPPGVKTLADGVFSGCEALEEIRLVPGLEAVGEETFRECSRLTGIRLPETVREVHSTAFVDCSSLGAVDVADGNPVFSSVDGVLFRDGGNELACYPGAKGGSYAVPTGTKRIGPHAFRASGVERVSVPESVESIGESAFRDCRRLHQATLGDGIREIGASAFAGCDALWKCLLPQSLERAGDGIFAGCRGLLMLVVPDGLLAEGMPDDSWQVPPFCTVRSRSAWEAEGRGQRAGTATDPFFGLYADADLDVVSFEGTVLATSAIPDPENNDYDHCLYALLVELDSVLSETPASTNIARVVLVNSPIMKDRTLIPTNEFVPGDKVFFLCADYDAMPQEIQEIQLSDDIQSFEHLPYYPLMTRKLAAFRKTGNKDFAKREITVLPIRSLPKDEHAAEARRERIQGELRRIESEVARHGGSFEAWRAEYRPIGEKWLQLCREDHAGWIRDSYFAAGGPETAYQTQEYIEGILPYKQYLEANNIDLIVVRMPTKWDFAARVLASDDFEENPAWMEHYHECLKHDIEIIDPMPEMWRERFDWPMFYFYTKLKEFHPFEGTSFVVAKETAKVLKRYSYEASASEITLADADFETDLPYFSWPEGNDKFEPGKVMPFQKVVRDGAPIGNLVPSSGSPFVFLSNSFFWYPQRPLGASVPGYTAYFLQALPDWFYQDGAHGHLIKSLCSRQALLNGRRAVVMVGDHKSWGSIPAIPKYILDHATRITLEKTLAPSSEEITLGNPDGFGVHLEDDGRLSFAMAEKPPAQRSKQLEMSFEIPGMAGKSTCMVRVNFTEAHNVGVNLTDVQGEESFDTCFLSSGLNQCADLFVPVSGSNLAVKVVFRAFRPEMTCTVNNVELWYY